ncbi:hypothetical protein Pan216_23710 [Planctomycetes bacterium Pan216]|uniref:Uncharacterized protein n=1 Tax=Kolteria novifilia TaxID=2527975 RepID=A0A518B3D9_9BACT|nr:hypothetical protein Pan216_23710 [Planctomycetes bacterium Pan216]
MDRSNWNRRDFAKVTAAAFGGIVAGTGMVREARADNAEYLLKEPHVCRGLNTCKNTGASKKNACAGQGTCATAKHITCAGQNDCKGQGGCHGKAGVNECKGKGGCAVPLMSGEWKKTRAKFEKIMKEKGKEVGPAPAK